MFLLSDEALDEIGDFYVICIFRNIGELPPPGVGLYHMTLCRTLLCKSLFSKKIANLFTIL